MNNVQMLVPTIPEITLMVLIAIFVYLLIRDYK
jgi:hypothetical protein